MTTLILNVDRDNDFGEKAGIKGPLVGYSQCYNAAVKLISTDPEDSDSNALFGALKHYELLQSKGEDVDIAMVTGDDDVGPKSDEVISSQLDLIIQPGKYKNVILISDGAEDDYILPLILSRAPIRYIKHIIVRHNQNIESLYYYIVRGMQDKKLVKKVAIPLGLILLTYGIAALGFALAFTVNGNNIGNSSFYAFILVIVVIGAYFMEKGFDIAENMVLLSNKLREYSEQARIMFISTIVSLGIFFVGIASTYPIFYTTDPVSGKHLGRFTISGKVQVERTGNLIIQILVELAHAPSFSPAETVSTEDFFLLIPAVMITTTNPERISPMETRE